MLSEKTKSLIEKLNMEYPAVAVKMLFERPDEVEHYERNLRSVSTFMRHRRAEKSFIYQKMMMTATVSLQWG